MSDQQPSRGAVERLLAAAFTRRSESAVYNERSGMVQTYANELEDWIRALIAATQETGVPASAPEKPAPDPEPAGEGFDYSSLPFDCEAALEWADILTARRQVLGATFISRAVAEIKRLRANAETGIVGRELVRRASRIAELESALAASEARAGEGKELLKDALTVATIILELDASFWIVKAAHHKCGDAARRIVERAGEKAEREKSGREKAHEGISKAIITQPGEPWAGPK